MPPKKRSTVQPSSRVTRSSMKLSPQILAGSQSSTPAPPPQPSSASMSAPIDRNATGTRKRKQVVVDPPSGNSEPELEPDGATMGNSQSRHRKRRQQESPAAKPTNKSAKRTKTTRPLSPDTILTRWFDGLKGDTDEIMITDSVPWMESLGVSPEGIAFWVIAYWCGAEGMGAIKLKEFVEGMKDLGVDSNDSLRRRLPTLLQDVAPGSDQFLKFYWFCYEFFKASDAKYIPLDMACEMFTALLDERSYSIKWTPPTESNNSLEAKGSRVWGWDLLFPHKDAFIEFLGSTPPPTKVITKDQYRQFIPFNDQVDIDFKGYTIETSVWPSLFDQFITWSKEKKSMDENSMDQS